MSTRKGTIMKDPRIHAGKTIIAGFGNARMRELILKGTGLACDMPKTVSCGCGRRRPFAMTSRIPAHVTCLACREWAAAQHAESARRARDLAEWMIRDPEGSGVTKLTPAGLEKLAAEDEAAAAAYT